MRTINAAGQALLARMAAGEQIPMVQLVQVDLDVPMYLTTAGVPLQWGGHTWLPVPLRVEPISEQAGGNVDQLAFVLPAVTEDQLALVLTEPVKGKAVAVLDALVDPATAEVVATMQVWAGELNVPGFQDGPEAAAQWTAEHRAVRAYRPKPSRYTHDEQQRLHPGDTALHVAAETDAAALMWPAASYFKQS